MTRKKIKGNKDIKNLVKKAEELEDKLKRALADYHNLSRRVEEKKCNWQEVASARIIDKLLDVYNDLCRARGQLKNKGLAMAINQFWAVLESEGVGEIKTDGETFDPETMDCIQVVKGLENRVVETVIKGYSLNECVIRPAKVKVGRGDRK